MEFEQAIQELEQRMMRAMKLRANGNPLGALKVLDPLIAAFDERLPAGETPVKTFQSVLELELYKFLSGAKEDPPDCGGAPANLLYYLYGNICLDVRDAAHLETAVKMLDKAIMLNPSSAQALMEMAECFKAARDWENFELFTRNAFAVNMSAAHIAHAYRNMGYLLVERNEFADAARFYHISKIWHITGSADDELEFIRKTSGTTVRKPNRRETEALCRKYDVPVGPPPAVCGLLRGMIKGFFMAGHGELAGPMIKLMKELHPGRSLEDLMKTPPGEPDAPEAPDADPGPAEAGTEGGA